MLPSLGPERLAALFVAMAVLAALPSTSVLLVTARAGAHGFRHGAWVAAGVVVGDLIYILVAIFGLQLLLAAMKGATDAIRALAALYLLGFAWRLWRATPATASAGDVRVTPAASTRESFVTGLLVTLGDQKAILFYLGFLPVFLDLANLRPADVAIVALVAVVAVGGVKLLYAALAGRAGAILGPRAARGLQGLAAAVMAGAAVFLLADTFLSSSRFAVPLF